MKNIEKFNNDFNNGDISISSYNNLINKYKYISNSSKKKLYKKEKLIKVKNGLQKITIIIPTYNRLFQLNECIDSIMKQTYQNFEIIIIDDSTNNDTKNVYENHADKRIKYLKNKKNLGMGLNRQKGYLLAKGDYVIFCDDDDYYIDNNYFNDAIEIFNDIKINMICSNSYINYEDSNTYVSYKLNMDDIIDTNYYLKTFQFASKKPTSTFPAIFRKEILDKANFKNMKMMNDSSIYLRALIIDGKVKVNKKIIGIYRMHSENDTLNVKADFTLENLNEKKYIYNYLKINKKYNFNLKKWYNKEIEITINHFFRGKENRWSEINKVIKWSKFNTSIFEYFKINLLYLKKICRNVVKK